MPSILLYGPGGAGKSFLEVTSPGPILIFDTEGRSDLLPRPYTIWDMTAAPPIDLTEESIVIVNCNELADIVKGIRWLTQPSSPFQSVWLDSATNLQKSVIYQTFGDAQLTQQHYGILLKKIEGPMLALRSLLTRPNSKLKTVGVTAWESEYDGKAKINLQGQISKFFEHTFDIIGRVTMTLQDSKEGIKIGQNLQIMPIDGVTAKAPGALYLKHGKFISNPNIQTIMKDMEKS